MGDEVMTENDERLWELIKNKIGEPLEKLFYELSIEDRKKVFPKLICEFVEANY